MEIISYIKPSLGMDLKGYLNDEMYDIYGGGNITYIEDSPPHINHGSMQINGNVILFNHIGRDVKERGYPQRWRRNSDDKLFLVNTDGTLEEINENEQP